MSEEYDNLMKDEQTIVEIYLQFNRIGVIDTMEESYHADVYIEAKWHDNDVQEFYDAEKHWNPRIWIENAIELTKNETSYRISKDELNRTVMTQIIRLKGTFWEKMALENFPIDLQELTVSIVSSLSPSEIRIIPDGNKPSFIDLEVKHNFIDQQRW